jgi:hypothetical protein
MKGTDKEEDGLAGGRVMVVVPETATGFANTIFHLFLYCEK